MGAGNDTLSAEEMSQTITVRHLYDSLECMGNDTSSSTREAMAEMMSQTITNLRKEVGVIQKHLNFQTVEIEDLRIEVDRAQTLIKDLGKKLSNTQTCLDTTKAENEVWKKKVQKLSKSKLRLAIKEAKSHMMERFDVVANKFQASLPYFVVFLGLLFAVELTCKTRAFYLCMVGSSILGIFLFAIIGVFRTLKIFRSFCSKRKTLRGMIADIGGQEGSDGHDSDSDSDLEGNVPETWRAIMNKQWLSFAWPTIAYISILVLYSWVCNIGVGMYIFNEGCVNDSSMDYIEYMEY